MRRLLLLFPLLCQTLSAEIQHVTLQLAGLACPFCNTHLVRVLEQTPGVHCFEMDLEPNRAEFRWDGSRPFNAAEFYCKVTQAGYTLESITLSTSGWAVERDGHYHFISSGEGTQFLLNARVPTGRYLQIQGMVIPTCYGQLLRQEQK